MYFSAHDDAFLDTLARRVRRLRRAGEVRVIFDNTATLAAADNARSLLGRTGRSRPSGCGRSGRAPPTASSPP
jgi:uncharacterized protein YecE (DUF72 family)